MSAAETPPSVPDRAGPVVILVEPQLGENIGMAARAMGNFGLTRLRLVKPRDGWPSLQASRASAGADYIIDHAELYDSVEAAVADLNLLFATTARAHDQAKPVVGPEAAAAEIIGHVAGGGGAGIMFGRERYGLLAEEVALADRIITFPVNPAFASLNLAQAVLLVGYEWFKQSTGGALPHGATEHSPRAGKEQLGAFFDNLVAELDKVEFLRPPEKRSTMLVNLRNIFTRMEPTTQDIHTLHGVILSIAEGRKGPAKGGVLDGSQATRLRALISEQSGKASDDGGSLRGLARLLRRNPTDAERSLWNALRSDRRFAGHFKRQTPVGRHIPDFVSFPRRLVIEIVNADDAPAIVAERDARKVWLGERDYRVMHVAAADIEADLEAVLARLAADAQG
ncbi:MAG: TrmH family RNA methyltransferase [Pseudomonadota bacterium]